MRRRWTSLGIGLLSVGYLFGLSASAVGQSKPIADHPQTQQINELMAKAWADNNLKPSDLADDFMFCRRIYLDLIGRIPSPDEIRAFINNPSAKKRAELIKKLMRSEKEVIPSFDIDGKTKNLVKNYAAEYADNWAAIWSNWLLTRSAHDGYHEKLREWIAGKIKANTSHKQFAEELIAAKGATDANGAATYVMFHLGEPTPAGKSKEDGYFDAVPITSRTTRLFLGLQTQCTQCHDHPFNPQWRQEDFWGVNAFFRQTRRSGTPTPKAMRRNNDDAAMKAASIELTDESDVNPEMRVAYEKRSGEFRSRKAIFLRDLKDADNPDAPLKKMTPGSKSRREVLASFVTSHDNFAKAYVNRIWGHLFGRGLCEQPAVDDFGDHNKVVHEELLDFLAEEFIKYNYDPKLLIEWICNSTPYQLSYVANASNAKPEAEPYFSRMALKSMSPEQLFESLMEATRSEIALKGDAKATLRKTWMGKLVQNFGDDEGNEVTFNGTVVQALLMMNGRELNDQLRRDKDSMVDLAIRRARKGGGEDAIIKEIYLAALGRLPIRKIAIPAANPKAPPRIVDELTLVKNELAKFKANPGEIKDPDRAYQAFFEDLFWALLNTNEFILNH